MICDAFGNEPPAAEPDAQADLNEIAGWLPVFLGFFSIGAVINLVLGAREVVTWQSTSSGFAGLILAALGGYGGFCIRRLWDKDPSAPTHAQRYMGLVALCRLAFGLITGTYGGGGGLVFWAIWGTYLAMSRRVALVYRKSPA